MRRIAVLREAGGLGDVVMTEPAVRGLRARWPEAEILYAGLPEYEALVARFPVPPDVYLAVERSRRRDRDGPVDPARWPYLAAVAAADRVVDLFCPAFRQERAAGPALTQGRVEAFCRAAGVDAAPPSLRLAGTERAWERARAAGPLVALGPWACGARRQWPKARWRALAGRLGEDGCGVLVLHPFDGPVADVPGLRATGRSLPEAAALLAEADLAVTHDSGLLHLAEAVGTPTLSLWGSTAPAPALALYRRARPLEAEPPRGRPPGCRAPCFSLPGFVDAEACRRGCRRLEALPAASVRAAVHTALAAHVP